MTQTLATKAATRITINVACPHCDQSTLNYVPAGITDPLNVEPNAGFLRRRGISGLLHLVLPQHHERHPLNLVRKFMRHGETLATRVACRFVSSIGDRVTAFANQGLDDTAVALGRKGGRATSDAKAEAARQNGKKGGRPPKPK